MVERRTLDLLAATGDAALAIDREGVIVGWNPAAERLLGWRAREALGRACYEVLGCQATTGQPLAPESCPLQQAIRSGQPPPCTEMIVRHRRGHRLPVSGGGLMVDSSPPRAVLLIRGSAAPLAAFPLAEHETSACPPLADGCAGLLTIEHSLDRLLLMTGADAAEVFLSVPVDGRLVLACHRGRAARAFHQIVQFERGQGFPGLVAEQRQPLISPDVARDDRFLRTEVKRRGFHAYLCVPIPGEQRVLGSLHVAARRRDGLTMHLPLLNGLARDIGLTLEVARWRAADAVANLADGQEPDGATALHRTADQVLRSFLAFTQAESGALFLAASSGGDLALASAVALPSRLRRRLARPQSALCCPAATRQRCVLPGEAAGAPSSTCRLVARCLATSCCLPLVASGGVVGVVMLGWRRRQPHARRFPGLLDAMMARAAQTLQRAVASANAGRPGSQAASANGQGASGGASAEQPAEAEPATGRTSCPTPGLDLRCLGTFAVFRDGWPVPLERFARRRSLTLFKILLTRYGKPVHREELIELLWPEEEPQHAQRLLHVAVHYLRRGLEPETASGQASRYILTSGDSYAFNTAAPHRLDSRAFAAAVDEALSLARRGDRVAALASCDRAAALYSGDFLEDERYADWCALEREYLRERYLTALRLAARLHLEQGDPDAAIDRLRRALAVDPALEEVHRDLMAALWRAGRRDEALRQYQACRVALRQELGLSPLPETETLARQIAAAAR